MTDHTAARLSLLVTTANTLDSIPRPLLGRMEVLRLAGYSDEEKLQIARRPLIPRQLGQAGLSADHLRIPDETLGQVLRQYTREAGVRQLERALPKENRNDLLDLPEEVHQQVQFRFVETVGELLAEALVPTTEPARMVEPVG